MLRVLVQTEGVPVDVFQHIGNIRVEKYLMPMYMLNGEIHAPWNATQVERRQREVGRDRYGMAKTEYYDEKWPISGTAQSAYWLLSSANCNSELPYALREYGKVIEYTHTMATGSISDKVQEINYQLPDGCREIETDTDSNTVFQSQIVTDYINRLAHNAAMSQLPSRYENFHCSPRWTNNVVEFVGVAVYLIQFTYKGYSYSYCIDGLGQSHYCNFPQDQDAIGSLHKSIRNKRIFTWLLVLIGIIMPIVGNGVITRWPPVLLVAFIAMPLVMLIPLHILITKERKAVLSNEEEQREYGRRLYLGLDTSDINGNANTKLRAITAILLWIGLAVDIAAIVISLTLSKPYASIAHETEFEDNATEKVETKIEERDEYDASVTENIENQYESQAEKEEQKYEGTQDEMQRRQQEENEWIYGTWTCRVVREVPNSYIGSVSTSYKLMITSTYIQVFLDGQERYDGSYSIENDRIVYYLEDGTRENIPIDRASHRLRLYGSNYYTKS